MIPLGAPNERSDRPTIHLRVRMLQPGDVRPGESVRAAARRETLGGVLGPQAAERLTISKEPSGRVRLLGPGAEGVDLCSASTAGLVCVAVGVGCRVGLDAERVRPEMVDEALAREALAPEEFGAFLRAADPVAYFFDVWTMKEAVLKASGLGLSHHPATLPLTAAPDHPGWRRATTADGRAWLTRTLAFEGAAALAIATTDGDAKPELALPREIGA